MASVTAMLPIFALWLATCLGAASSDVAAPVRIGFYIDAGTSAHLDPFYETLAVAADALGKFSIQNLTADAVRNNVTRESFDIIVFPGGSGNGQAKAIGEAGMAAVRDFVSAGGGYIGTCGGAFLGLQHIKFYGDPAPKTQEPFNRGHGTVLVEFTSEGFKEIGLDTKKFGGNVTIMYWQGPIVKTADFPQNVSKLAFFRTEIHSHLTNETKGEMVNTPAITSVAYGKGHVVLNSPHPELTPNIPEIYAGELKWVLPKTVGNTVFV